jgi:hypothetical protein
MVNRSPNSVLRFSELTNADPRPELASAYSKYAHPYIGLLDTYAGRAKDPSIPPALPQGDVLATNTQEQADSIA